jgi:putative transposase
MNYERKRIRLSGWDYSTEGVYFITICCLDRKSYLGKIRDNKMIHSEIGFMASQYWSEIPIHYSNVRLDEYVIMPNHLHGLLILDKSLVGPRHGVALQTSNNSEVGSCHGMTLRAGKESLHNFNQFSKPVKNSVSVIINQFKSSVKRWCNKNGFVHFQWQSRFYDHILNDEDSIEDFREYICNNPRNWNNDELNIL